MHVPGCGDVVFHPFDLADQQSAKALSVFVKDKYGQVDILVNNAAICFNDPTLYGKVGNVYVCVCECVFVSECVCVCV